tara:strand:+ start:309 stop:554 length:246 start_codon:yes stop_codon:yes gene_type:complete
MGDSDESYEIAGAISFLALCIYLIKALFGILYEGLSQINESLTPSTDNDFLLLGAAIPFFFELIGAGIEGIKDGLQDSESE